MTCSKWLHAKPVTYDDRAGYYCPVHTDYPLNGQISESENKEEEIGMWWCNECYQEWCKENADKACPLCEGHGTVDLSCGQDVVACACIHYKPIIAVLKDEIASRNKRMPAPPKIEHASTATGDASGMFGACKCTPEEDAEIDRMLEEGEQAMTEKSVFSNSGKTVTLKMYHGGVSLFNDLNDRSKRVFITRDQCEEVVDFLLDFLHSKEEHNGARP